ncbi:MAG: hypothetical protein LBS36_01690 [Oscillospiraceae bacterium]|jgi:hypothetical protein|nr:hypothetical protein [Oscillospiraceae bacterium]
MNASKKTERRLIVCLSAIAILFVMLVITTYALVYSMVALDGSFFDNAYVALDLNQGKPVFSVRDTKLAPGGSFSKPFTITNRGTVDVWYRIYLEDVRGTLAEAVDCEIYEGGELVHSGRLSELTQNGAYVSISGLAVNETRTLTAVLKMPGGTPNDYNGGWVTFDLAADAVQLRNNPGKLFA